MKKFTKVCLIIAAVLGGAGLLLCGIASVMGGYGMIRQMADNGELNHGKWHIRRTGIYYGDDSYDRDEDERNEYEAEKIKNLDIDIDAANVLFTEGEQTDVIVVTLYNCRKSCYEGTVEGDTLYIEYESKHDIYNGNTDMKIVVAFPAGMNFDEIDIDMGAANVVADEFHVKELLDVTVGAGNLEIADGSYKNIKLSCGMGNVDMQGTVSGDVNVECGMGNMNVRLEGNPDAYDYELSCGVGEMVVNGVKYSGIAGDHQIKNDGASGTIDIECGMGSVNFTID